MPARRGPISVEVKADFSAVKPLLRRIRRANRKAAEKMAEAIARESQLRAPDFTGALKASMRVRTRPVRRGYVAEVSYGNRGRTRDYALVVHEEPESRRRTGERHFLLNAMESVDAGKEAAPPLRAALIRRPGLGSR